MRKLGLLLVLAFLAACSKEDKSASSAPPAPAARHFEPAGLTRGAALFEQHCALCHGPQAQGHPDWQTPNNGSFAAAPPLDGTGNDWKRSRAEMAAAIQNGIKRKSDNEMVMPAWKGRLKDQEVEDVINWLQSLWPAEVYEAWSKTQANTATPKS